MNENKPVPFGPELPAPTEAEELEIQALPDKVLTAEQALRGLLLEFDSVKCQYDLAAADLATALQLALEPVEAKLEEIEAAAGPAMDELATKLQVLTAEIKRVGMEAGHTVSTDNWQAVFSRGPSSWDGKALDGAAKLFPELLQYKRPTNPSVSIRPRQGK